MRIGSRTGALLLLAAAALVWQSCGSDGGPASKSQSAEATATAGPVAVDTSGWLKAGTDLSTDTGAFRFVHRVVPVDLVQSGLTYVRVTNGQCSAAPDAFQVYEAALSPPPSGEVVWSGSLAPVGSAATPLQKSPNDPDVYVSAQGISSIVTVIIKGVQPNTSFVVCFRRP